jgi:pimeloyl-ACP methyl ester carboxylesterase
MRPISHWFAGDYGVINYDRRGRGDSGDTAGYAVAREVADIDALIAAAGGTALVYGHSSGAALALNAAAAGSAISKLVLHEPPFVPSGGGEQERSRAYGSELRKLLAEQRHGEAVELFMSYTGTPAQTIEAARRDPSWRRLEALAPTLAYDSEVMGDLSAGGTLPVELLPGTKMPVLALYGEASPSWMKETAERIADGVNQGQCLGLEGQHHVVSPAVLAPVLAEFFG